MVMMITNIGQRFGHNMSHRYFTYSYFLYQVPWYSHMAHIDSESSIDSLSMDRTPPHREQYSISTDSDDSAASMQLQDDIYSSSSDEND